MNTKILMNNSYRLFCKAMDENKKTTELYTNTDTNTNTNIDELLIQINNYDTMHHLEISKWRIKELVMETTTNPDLYDDFPVKQSDNNKNKNKKGSKVKKEKVDITQEVNSIPDLLHIIHTYPIDASKEYNIDMIALHNIKEPLQKLNEMIGMKSIKENIVCQLLFYIQELHNLQDPSSADFLHTVIYGAPGTGKTEIAKIIGDIFSKLNILKKGTFKKVTRSDLIAGYLGQTALKTQDVIKECLGGVLFIDEAYALGSSDKRDSFSKECIDTLCEALSDHKDKLMVIIAGYEAELDECFFKNNQGLQSRFIWRFKTDEYSAEDLYNIFVKKVKDAKWKLTDECNKHWFDKKKDYFKYYGRDMETLFTKTKMLHSKRIFGKTDTEKKYILMKDLDNGFELFIQNEEVKKRKECANMKKIISSMYI